MSGSPITFKGQHIINLLGLTIIFLICTYAVLSHQYILVVVAISFLVSSAIIPIGGADMPVVISMLNSYSGWAGGIDLL